MIRLLRLSLLAALLSLAAEACVEDAEQAAEALRRLWKLGIDPIPSVAELLEDKGVKVIALDLPENVSGSKAFVQRPKRKDGYRRSVRPQQPQDHVLGHQERAGKPISRFLLFRIA